ncbi:serine/arginine repetitive matrix protein 1-like [Acanthaster planci]|uniref:Serine/arginine repetitive matrix protein 1-like n=1 Tax=Acanthaster planci TaxID=133434 RepID=A0A8B7ZPW3_ACAPL|nr:serine/arginine repetitive matrix protein 1-like [Acanthaster planci]
MNNSRRSPQAPGRRDSASYGPGDRAGCSASGPLARLSRGDAQSQLAPKRGKILSGGSLGSCADEERSQLRESNKKDTGGLEGARRKEARQAGMAGKERKRGGQAPPAGTKCRRPRCQSPSGPPEREQAPSAEREKRARADRPRRGAPLPAVGTESEWDRRRGGTPQRVGGLPRCASKPRPLGRVEPLRVQILVVVANIRVRSSRAEWRRRPPCEQQYVGELSEDGNLVQSQRAGRRPSGGPDPEEGETGEDRRRRRSGCSRRRARQDLRRSELPLARRPSGGADHQDRRRKGPVARRAGGGAGPAAEEERAQPEEGPPGLTAE